MSALTLKGMLVWAGLALLFPGALTSAEEMPFLQLPEPRFEAGRPLMQALKERRSTREFSPKPLPDHVLSELLWAAYGINRPESGYRTAPSAHNRQEIDVYVALAAGLYLYDAVRHGLVRMKEQDLRSITGRQKFPAAAPLNLVYVANLSRMPGVPRDAAIEAAAVSAGAIVQNVYLYAASERLAAVVRGWFDRSLLTEAMGLGDDRYIIVVQTVGYPAGSR